MITTWSQLVVAIIITIVSPILWLMWVEYRHPFNAGK